MQSRSKQILLIFFILTISGLVVAEHWWYNLGSTGWEIGENWGGATFPIYTYASSNCATAFDYCYFKEGVKPGNYTIDYVYNAVLDEYTITGLSNNNLDGLPYYVGNMSTVYINLALGDDGITEFNITNDSIIVSGSLAVPNPEFDPDYSASNLTVCFSGEEVYFYNPFVGGSGYPQRDLINSDTLKSYYRRNWTFNLEEDNTLFSFDDYQASLTVICDNYGSFEYDLDDELPAGGSLSIQTLEKPKFRLYLKTIYNESNPDDYYATEYIREDEDYFLKDEYYLENNSLMYSFSLIDHTSQCDNLVRFSRLVGNDEQIIQYMAFDNDRKAFPYLMNDTEYKVKVFCIDGSVRDLGYVKTINQDARNIEIPNIKLGEGSTYYEGGLVVGNITADYDSEIIYLTYAKDEGYLDLINLTVYDVDATPMAPLYSSAEQYTAGGSFTYDTNNRSKNYYVELIAENDGKTFKNSFMVEFTNLTRVAFQDLQCKLCPLPEGGLMGIDDMQLYKLAGLFGLVVIGLGFAAIDAGFAALAMVVWEMFMDRIKWHDIPTWLMTMAILLALGLLWGMNRRADE